MHQSMLSASLKSVMQGLTWKGGRGALQGGDHKQNGGEFWFVKDKETKDATMGDWKVEWCHRMRNTRDHVEIADLREVMCKGCWCPEPNLATPRGRNEVKVKKEEREHGPTVTILDRHGRVKSEGSPKPKRRSRSSSLLRALSLRKNRERAESKERAGYAKLAEGGDRAIEVA